MKTALRRSGFVVLTILFLTAPVRGQLVDIFHDPFLNWDFLNFTGVPANNFEIIVEAPNFKPNAVYTGFFPSFGTTPVDAGQHTRLSWSGRDVAPDTIAHVGLAMQGSGRILDAYWTLDGERIPGGSLAIIYELTRVRRPPVGFGDVAMLLQAVRGPDVLTAPVSLQNIRTFLNIPSDMVGLNDLNASLDLRTLANFEQTGNAPTIENLPSSDFFTYEVGRSEDLSPAFEALLTADVVVGGRVIGRFWNLNPQCPEPTAMGLMAVGSLLTLRRRR